MKKTEPKAYSTDGTRWEAVLSRDPAADGIFYYAVRATGVYCRPPCPSRRPLRAHVAFFEDADSAEQAGFRPCRRCRPNEVAAPQQLVAQVLHLLETVEPCPSLTDLAQAIGRSPFHLQRLFKRVTGLTPKQYVAARRVEMVKAGLKEGATVTRAMYDAGYGSSRALYERANQHLGMSPMAYKRGGQSQQIMFTLTDSPLGRMLVASTARGLCAVRFGEDTALLQELQAEYPKAELVQRDGRLGVFVRAIRNHLTREKPRRLDLPLDVQATAFQARVWDALRSIPYGHTCSYAQIARAIGEPKAVRAVARACASNPVALVVPCHRVVRADGKLSGYRWSAELKQRLLDQERRHGKAVRGD